MKRRTFLELAGLSLGSSLVPSALGAKALSIRDTSAAVTAGDADAYGSGHFGHWVRDAHGLPAYDYTCNQLTDPLAVLPVDKTFRSPTDHMHQVGNDRLVAVASNYGHVQVRQDEGSPKFLNDYNPTQNQYGGGVGFLAGESFVLSTYYTGAAESFERTFGIGYVRKRVSARGCVADQVILAPYGDDPVLISQVTISNRSSEPKQLRWVEYWGCQNYQFSWRSLMESAVPGGGPTAVDRRRQFAARFRHRFAALPHGRGLRETQTFLGRTPEEEQAWQRTQASLEEKPAGFFGGPTPPLAAGASMDDGSPPPTFLASLDAPADRHSTDATRFFRGGIEHPAGLSAPLDDNLAATGPESAFLLERKLTLKPGESHTMYFLYGYVPEGFSEDALIAKYAADPASAWPRSSAQWQASGSRFLVEGLPWVEREWRWSSYYLRSGLTYDSFFREHILSQGASYQYLAGLQGAARDPLQHVLPFVFTDPAIVRSVLRYTLKEIQSDGSIPYAIVGSGVPMPCVYRPSDLQLWLVWSATDYVLATRDRAFLNQRVPPHPRRVSAPNDPTVLELLTRSFAHLRTVIGTGKHGMLRLFNGDWNDSIVYTHLTPEQQSQVIKEGESVLNAAMATYVLDYFAELLDFVEHAELATQARAMAEEQRKAVRAQWTGRWYRRAWLNDELGWVGEKQMWLEPQPWAILGGCVPGEKAVAFVSTLDELARRPSPMGALLQSQPDPTMKDEPGTGTNAGIFAAINGTLVWALSLVNGEMAWDEWRKNTLACHAETYPAMWFGIWSGPDAYHSVFAKWPGGTGPDFPVLNMHSHAWPLYSAVKMLGTQFHPRGVRFRPVIPLTKYEFISPLLGFRKTDRSYSGWYAPISAGTWTVELDLPEDDLRRLRKVRVNGVQSELRALEGRVQITGASAPGHPLQWEIS